MNAERALVSSKQFTRNEKQELIEYLCRDCRPIEGGDYPSELPRGDGQDCGEYLEHGLHAYFMTRFVDLLNIEDPHYRIPRMIVRRLWGEDGLPKCQMTALCQYVRLGLETDRIPENEKTYSGYLSDIRDQVNTVFKEFRTLKFLLKQEQDFAARKFSFLGHDEELASHDEELASIIDLADNCLIAAQEIRGIRRKSFNVQTRENIVFAVRKLACKHTLIHIHKNRGTADPGDISLMLPILHEAIDGRIPKDNACSRYDKDNLIKEAKRLEEENSQNTLQSLEQGIEAISPGSLNIDNKSWKDAPRIPKKVLSSDDCSEIISLSEIHQVYLSASDHSKFLDELKDFGSCLLAGQKKSETSEAR